MLASAHAMLLRVRPFVSATEAAFARACSWVSSERGACIHAAKVGVAVLGASCLSLFWLVEQEWAVITVIIIMQPTLGATLSKTTQRMLGTLAAASAALIVDIMLHSHGYQCSISIAFSSEFGVPMIAKRYNTIPVVTLG